METVQFFGELFKKGTASLISKVCVFVFDMKLFKKLQKIMFEL